MDQAYPIISINQNLNANRFYAIPLIGFIAKIILLIPYFIAIFGVSIGLIFILLINSFCVLFNGKYWDFAYNYNRGIIRMGTKMYFYLTGLTDKYPEFNFNNGRDFTLEINQPQNPNRWFAFPILGGVVRIILLIPYYIYSQVLQSGAYLGVFLSFAKVLFESKYPESTYEFARDSQRVSQATGTYLFGLSDSYPSFKISMNHKNIKIALIIGGIILTILQWSHRNTNHYQYQYQPQPATYTSQTTSPTY